MHGRLGALQNASRTVISISKTYLIHQRYEILLIHTDGIVQGRTKRGAAGARALVHTSKVCVSVGGWDPPFYRTPSLLNRPHVLISLFSHILELKLHNILYYINIFQA